jgi:photosystem II stability/assembly factor-like uncharacterized protein
MGCEAVVDIVTDTHYNLTKGRNKITSVIDASSFKSKNSSMSFSHFTFLYCGLSIFLPDLALDYRQLSQTTASTSVAASPGKQNDGAPGARNIILQSKDNGKTWEDISYGLPENVEPEDLFAGESDIYLRSRNGMYRSKNNLKSPVWEKEDGLDPKSASIAFNHSGIMAYNYEGQIYQKPSSAGIWSPIYTNVQTHSMRTIYETTSGIVFVGYDGGLYKSSDRGKSWRQVQNEGWVMHMVESKGVLVATGQKGIMRSTDNGEHWEWVIREGGVGIAIEQIDGGFAAISCNTKTITRRIHVSFDDGKTWKSIDDGLRPSLFISSIKKVGKYLICGHPDGIFRSSDFGKTWNIVHPSVENNGLKYRRTLDSDPFDDHKKVFKIYVSGNTVYAVAGNAGC